MQIPIIQGIYTDEDSDFRIAYPRNLVPVPKAQGLSAGYLKPSEGINVFGTSGSYPGVMRGAINWNDELYCAMGSKLVKVDSTGAFTVIGNIGGAGASVTFDYSFNYLSITSNNNLFMYDGVSFKQVTDIDLGASIDHIWVDGYFMSTDGEYLVVTELNDPFTVLTTKYGSSEADPDPVKAILKIGNEPYALNRYTIEVFDNAGGSGFPFQRIEGAQIGRGTVGTHACCTFLNSVAFMGGGRDEGISIWLGGGGGSIKVSTQEVDDLINKYGIDVLKDTLLESRVDRGHQFLYIHLPNQTLVYDGSASQQLGQPVWHILTSSIEPDSIYRARYFTRCYDKWIVGDTNAASLGYLDRSTGEHWGSMIGWEFNTAIMYNDGNNAIVHELELVALTGRSVIGADPRIYTEYSLDGESWSMPKFIEAGKVGDRLKRLVWLYQGPLRHWRIQRFKGTSDARLSFARLEARVEPLSN